MKFESLQRRNPELAHLIKFLKLADFLAESHDEFGVKIQKTKVTTLATNVMKRLFKANEADQDDDGFEIEVEDVAEENKEVSKMEISMYDELNIFLQEQDPQQSQLECGFVPHIIKKKLNLTNLQFHLAK